MWLNNLCFIHYIYLYCLPIFIELLCYDLQEIFANLRNELFWYDLQIFFPSLSFFFWLCFWYFFILWKIPINFLYVTFEFWFRLWKAFLFRDYFESSLFSSATLLWLYSLYTSFLLRKLGVISKHVYLIQALGNWEVKLSSH